MGKFPQKLLALNPDHGRQHRLHQHPDHRHRRIKCWRDRRLPVRGKPSGHKAGRDRQLHQRRRGGAQSSIHAGPRLQLRDPEPVVLRATDELLPGQLSCPPTCATSTSPPTAATSCSCRTGFVPFSGGVGRDLCDAAARFETNITNPTRPTWINYSGGDTFHSVAATGAAVYVQGHIRALDNPNGTNGPLPGSSPRQGIGAINPTSGLALPWNPGKTRGVGGKDFLVTPAGLWVGSDGRLFAGEVRDNLAFLPL